MAGSVLLAKKYEESVDPTGWWMSEKLDGVRAYWTGSAFYSRLGNKFLAPAFFTKDLPKTPLDGELWCGRGLFSKVMSIVKKTKNLEKFNDDWKHITYLVFDAPDHKGTFEERMAYIKKVIDVKKSTTFAVPVGHVKCDDRKHLKVCLKKVLLKNGEGLMLRKPGSAYERCRSGTLLKVKYFHDEEARVLSAIPGTGRCSSMMGKLECVLANGVKFKVGTGFSDAQRKSPPRNGSIITFKYQELSDHGHPRFPVFVRARPDLTWDDVIANAKTKVPFSSIKRTAPALGRQHSILFSTVPSRDAAGRKIVCSDDEDEDEVVGPSSEGSALAKGRARKKEKKPMCKYGSACFRTGAAHLAAFEHPPKVGDMDANLSDPLSLSDDAEPSFSSDSVAGSTIDKISDPSRKRSAHGDAAASSSGKHSEGSARVANRGGGKKRKLDLPGDDEADESKESKSTVGFGDAKEEEEKPACIFGDKCFRRSAIHRAMYLHPRIDAETKAKASDYDFGLDDEEDEGGDARHVSEDEGDDTQAPFSLEEDEDFVTIPRRDWNEMKKTVERLTQALLARDSALVAETPSAVNTSPLH
jgi:DNA ligase-1